MKKLVCLMMIAVFMLSCMSGASAMPTKITPLISNALPVDMNEYSSDSKARAVLTWFLFLDFLNNGGSQEEFVFDHDVLANTYVLVDASRREVTVAYQTQSDKCLYINYYPDTGKASFERTCRMSVGEFVYMCSGDSHKVVYKNDSSMMTTVQQNIVD